MQCLSVNKILSSFSGIFYMDCSLPGSSIHGIFQTRVLEWVAISFSGGSSWLRDRTQVSSIAGRHFTVWATREAYKLHTCATIDPSTSKIFYLKVRVKNVVDRHCHDFPCMSMQHIMCVSCFKYHWSVTPLVEEKTVCCQEELQLGIYFIPKQS